MNSVPLGTPSSIPTMRVELSKVMRGFELEVPVKIQASGVEDVKLTEVL